MIGKNNLNTFFRVWSVDENESHWENVNLLNDKRTIYIKYLHDTLTPKNIYWKFTTDGIFYKETQREIYEKVTDNLVEKYVVNCIYMGFLKYDSPPNWRKFALGGKDAIIMAFGQTRTGKSFTINNLENLEEGGIIPKLIQDIFKIKSSLGGSKKMIISVSYIETTKNVSVDLLKPFPNFFTINTMAEITKISVLCEDQVLRLLYLAEGRKEFCKVNKLSHIANSIFTFYITVKDKRLVNLSNCVKIHVVDLAGADTDGKYPRQFKQSVEMGFGNLAKTQLEQFLLILCENIPKKIKIKQRTNVLIKHLGRSLSNHNILRFIGHVKLSTPFLPVTLSMLRFGQVLSNVKPPKFDNNPNEQVIKDAFLETELGRLQAETPIGQMLANNQYTPLTQDYIENIQRTAQDYILDKTDENVLLDIAEAKICFVVLKKICKNYEDERIKLINEINAKVTEIPEKKEVESVVETKKETMSAKSSISTARSKQSTMPRKTSGSKRVSGSTISTFRKEKKSVESAKSSRSSKIDLNLVPELNIPEYKDAWDSYLTAKQDFFNSVMEQYKHYESKAKVAYRNYLTAVQNLNAALQTVDKTKCELVQSELMKGCACNSCALEEIRIGVKLCAENVKKAETYAIESQEEVLYHQCELQIYINMGYVVKGDLKTSFENYCKDVFHIPIINFAKEDIGGEDMKMEKIMESVESELLAKQKDERLKVKKYTFFIMLMEREKKRQELLKQKYKDWCKY